MNAAVNLASRPRIRNFSPSAWSPRFISRSRACWVTHSPVGWAVIPAVLADLVGGVINAWLCLIKVHPAG